MLGILIARPVVDAFAPALSLLSLLLMLPALLSLGPLLWLYIASLTSEKPWRWQNKNFRHFSLAMIGAGCALLTALLPDDIKVPLLTTGETSMNAYVGALMIAVFALVLVWLLSVWGLTQRPGFAGRYLTGRAEAESGPEKAIAGKYQKSSLGDEQSKRIAAKIEKAMQEDKLFLDPDISLTRLARAIAVTPNYLSQTLNETLGQTFFDYINRWRIEAAKPLIAANEKSVLEVALSVGFNARSSFYKAFKLHTGMTPGEYRQQALA